MLKRATVLKMRVNKESGDSSGGSKVKSVTDTPEVTYVVMAGARKRKFVWKTISSSPR